MSNLKSNVNKITKTDGIIVSTKALADMFGVVSKRIMQLTDEGILEKVGRGSYDLTESVRKYVTHLKTRSGAADDAKSVTNEKDKQEMLLKTAKREKAELELQLLKGDLIKADEVKQLYGGMVLTFRSKMLALPTKVAPQLLDIQNLVTVQDILSEEIYSALTELSKTDTNTFIKPKVDSDG